MQIQLNHKNSGGDTVILPKILKNMATNLKAAKFTHDMSLVLMHDAVDETPILGTLFIMQDAYSNMEGRQTTQTHLCRAYTTYIGRLDP